MKHTKKIITIIAGVITVGAIALGPKTQGALNTAVNQENIQTTICVSGYTSTIRPPANYTTTLKIKQIKDLNLKDTNTKDYEEDHLISLELGGNPTDPNNLWPQPYPEAHSKDTVENYLHKQVCSGKITLKEAQEEVVDWKPVYEKLKAKLGGITTDQDDEL